MPAFFSSQGFLSIGVNYDPLRRCVKSRILTDALFAPFTSPGGADCITNPCCISFGRAVSDSSFSLRRCDNRYAVRIKQERSVHIRTQPRPQGFSLKKWVGREKPHPFFKGKTLGTRLIRTYTRAYSLNLGKIYFLFPENIFIIKSDDRYIFRI